MTNEFISTGELSRQLGITVTPDFLKEKIKINPQPRPVGKKAGVFWRQSDVPKICLKLAEHFQTQATLAAQKQEEDDDEL